MKVIRSARRRASLVRRQLHADCYHTLTGCQINIFYPLSQLHHGTVRRYGISRFYCACRKYFVVKCLTNLGLGIRSSYQAKWCLQSLHTQVSPRKSLFSLFFCPSEMDVLIRDPGPEKVEFCWLSGPVLSAGERGAHWLLISSPSATSSISTSPAALPISL